MSIDANDPLTTEERHEWGQHARRVAARTKLSRDAFLEAGLPAETADACVAMMCMPHSPQQVAADIEVEVDYEQLARQIRMQSIARPNGTGF